MKLRKLAALAMTAVLSLTVLAGCGSDDKNKIKSDGKSAASISEAFEKAAAMDKYTFNGSFTMTVSGDAIEDIDEEFMSVIGGGNGVTLSGTWDGKADNKNNEADVSLGVSLGGKSSVKLLDYVLADGDAYVGLGTMVDGMDKLLKEMSEEQISVKELIGDELPDGNYLKVSKETLNEIMNIIEDSYGDMLKDSGMPIASGSYEDMMSEFMSSDQYKKAQESIKYFAELIVKGMKNGSDTCFTNDGDIYRVTINKNNINDILSGVLDEVQKNSDDIAKRINDIAGEDVVTVQQLEQMTSLLSVYDIATLMGEYDFSVSLSASYVDDTFKTGVAFAFSDSSNKMALSFENTAKKDESLKISAPSDVIADQDAKPIIDEFMNGLREGINETAGNITFDDDWDNDDWDDDNSDNDNQNNNSQNNSTQNNNSNNQHHDDVHHNTGYNNTTDNNEKDTANSSSNVSDKQYASIKEYVEDDEFQKQVEQQMKSYEGMGMSMTITGEGNKLVYTYKYTDEKLIDDDFTLEDAREYFDEAINGQKSTFTSLCKQLPIYIDVENPVVVLRYYDFDNTLIYEKEFTADN